MKIKITSNPVTPYGSFNNGAIISDENYPIEFLNHLVDDCGAAERILDYDTKVDEGYEAKKKPPSSQLLQQGKASQRKTLTLPAKKVKLSQSMTHLR